MHAIRRPRTTWALLALGVVLALLDPGVAGRPTAADAPGSLRAWPVAGPEQGLARARAGRSLVAPVGIRDDRDRPGPAVPALVALTVAAAGVVLSARRAARPAGHHAAATAARAPPPLRPATS